MKKFLALSLAATLTATMAVSFSAPASADASAQAVAIKGTPTVDGSLSEWGDATPYTLSKSIAGSVDTSGWFKVKWDNEAIYFAAEITDPTHSVSPDSDWFQFLIDFDGVAAGDTAVPFSSSRNAGLYSFNSGGWTPGGQNDPQVYDTGSQALAAAGVDVIGNSSTPSAFNVSYANGKYTVETKFVPANDTLKAKLAKGAKLGFNIQYENNWNGSSRDKLIGWSDSDGVFSNDLRQMGQITLDIPFTIKSGEIAKGTPNVDLKEDLIWKKVAGTPIGNVILNAGWGLGATEVTGTFKTLWDDKGLYFWIAVDDKTPNVTASGGADYWRRDSVDIFIDQENNDTLETDKAMGGDAGYFSITGAGDYSNPQGGMSSSTTKLMGKATDTGYVYEGFVKWTREGVAEADNVIGFDIQINDNQTGATRNAAVAWSDDSALNFSVVNKYGDLKLVDLGYTAEPTVQTPSSSAPSDKPVTELSYDEATLNWEATQNAAIYVVNVFKVVDSQNLFVKSVELDGSKLSTVLTGLDTDSEYAYQVLAYDADGNALMIYSLASFQTESETPDNSDPDDSSDDTDDPDSSDPDKNPETADMGIPFVVLAAVSGAALIVAKKRRNR